MEDYFIKTETVDEQLETIDLIREIVSDSDSVEISFPLLNDPFGTNLEQVRDFAFMNRFKLVPSCLFECSLKNDDQINEIITILVLYPGYQSRQVTKNISKENASHNIHILENMPVPLAPFDMMERYEMRFCDFTDEIFALELHKQGVGESIYECLDIIKSLVKPKKSSIIKIQSLLRQLSKEQKYLVFPKEHHIKYLRALHIDGVLYHEQNTSQTILNECLSLGMAVLVGSGTSYLNH